MDGNGSEFEGFDLDAERKILRRAGEIVPLPPKAVELLCVLIKNQGEVVSKNELLDAVWEGTFVEESVLSNNIYILRKTLSELGAGKDIIQTVPRRGYRFNAASSRDDSKLVLEHHVFEQTVIETDEEPQEKQLNQLQPAADRNILAGSARSNFSSKTIAFAAMLIILLAGSFAIWRFRTNQLVGKSNISEIKSIAVLPLKSFSANSDETLPLRIADALITRLGGLNQISVRPTVSILQFTKEGNDTVEIGKQLGVDAIIDGRIQQENEHVRVTLQLIAVKDGEQIWSGQFDGRSNEILKLQDAISMEISKAMVLPSHGNEFFSKNSTQNPQAFEAYLRGRYLWNMRTGRNLLKAIEEFEKAVEIDPNFALAYAGLADCYALLSVYEIKPSVEVFPVAKEKAQKALSLNPNLAEAHTTLGFIAYRFEWNWREAEQELQKAIALKPNYPTAYHWYGEMLMASGRFDEAETQYKKALELDPTSLIINTDLGYGFFLAHRYDESISQLQKTINLNSNFPLAYYCLADSMAYKGLQNDSVNTFKKWQELAEVKPADISQIETAFRTGGYADYLNARLKWSEEEAKRSNFTKTDVARFYAETGDKINALKWLEKAQASRDSDLIFIKTHPGFDNLRGENLFKEILRKMNL